MQQFRYKIATLLAYTIPITGMYNIDWPQSLSTPLQQAPYNYSLTMINLFYTASSLSVVLFSFKFGNILDRINIKLSLIFIPLIITILQTSIGILFLFEFKQLYSIIVGIRFVYGVFGQSTYILQAMVLTKLYKEKATNYIGLGAVISCTLEPLNSLLSPLIFTKTNKIWIPLIVGGGISCLILINCMVLTILLPNQQDKKIKNLNNSEQLTLNLIDRNQQQLINPTVIQQFKKFGVRFWHLQLLIFIFQSITAAFISIATDLLVKRFGIPYTVAGDLLMIPYLFSFISFFLLHYLIKKWPTKRRILFVIISSICLASHLILFFLPNTQHPNQITYAFVVLVLLIVGFSNSGQQLIISATINLIIPHDETGAAFGAQAMIEGLAYTVTPFMMSTINEQFYTQSEGYKYVSLLFIYFGIMAVLNTAYISLNDQYQEYDKDVEKQIE